MTTTINNIPEILEAALFAGGEPLSVEKLAMLFEETTRPSAKEIREHLEKLKEFYQNRGVELVEVANGYRFQARAVYASWLQRLWEQKPPRYGRAFLETLALIVYKQPITRGEIEEIRGVAVNTHIIKVLTERNWIKIVGHKDVPGKPALYGSTKEFLDYFNLKSLTELPTLDDLTNLDELEKQLNAQMSLDLKEQESENAVVNESEFIDENAQVGEIEVSAEPLDEFTREIEDDECEEIHLNKPEQESENEMLEEETEKEEVIA